MNRIQEVYRVTGLQETMLQRYNHVKIQGYKNARKHKNLDTWKTGI